MLLGGMVLGYKVLYREIIKRLFPRNNLVSVTVICSVPDGSTPEVGGKLEK